MAQDNRFVKPLSDLTGLLLNLAGTLGEARLLADAHLQLAVATLAALELPPGEMAALLTPRLRELLEQAEAHNAADRAEAVKKGAS